MTTVVAAVSVDHSTRMSQRACVTLASQELSVRCVWSLHRQLAYRELFSRAVLIRSCFLALFLSGVVFSRCSYRELFSRAVLISVTI